MAFSQLQQAIANLRISLAEMQSKERHLDSLVSQFRTQLRRLPRQVIYGRTSLDASLAAMGEIEERLAALELVKRVDEARRSLQDLRQRIRDSGEDKDKLAKVRRLEQFIAENSKRAELAITASYQERQER